MERNGGFRLAVPVCILIAALGTPAHAQYAGGSGTADDPYLIYTPEQMNAIGADPNDWDKHFQLMADIDLSQYTGTEFNLIGADAWHAFTGIFDGDNHTIANFSYVSEHGGWVGLFAYVNDSDAEIRNLGLIAPRLDITKGRPGYCAGALVGLLSYATITNCYVEGGTVLSKHLAGGLVGTVGGSIETGDYARLASCHSTCEVVGGSEAGGLVGSSDGLITNCYAAGVVTGHDHVGGLVGSGTAMTGCYADGIVRGNNYVGGLVGWGGTATNCHARGVVIGNEYVGGLAGAFCSTVNCYAAAVVLGQSCTGGLKGYGERDSVVASFWDVQTSRQASSSGGWPKTTAELQTLGTFCAWAGADHAGIWMIDEGNDYPRLAWENQPGIVIGSLQLNDLLTGAGTADDPYLIYTPIEMAVIAGEPNEWDKHFKLMADIDLSAYPGVGFNASWRDINPSFTGAFDGNGHTISNFTYVTPRRIAFAGFFGYVQRTACGGRTGVDCDSIAVPLIENLGLINPVVDGRLADYSGALVGCLGTETFVSDCYVEGGLVLGGSRDTGGLAGLNYGMVTGCHGVGATVIGGRSTHGLVGSNEGLVEDCYSENTTIEEQDAEF